MESQLCDILRNINPSANFGRRIGVSFPIFDGSEKEHAFQFLDKFKRAATLNGWNDDDLPIGLPQYLKGHASAWFKCLQGANEMTFDELSTAMINHFVSRATQWRIRQTLSKLRQLEKESVSCFDCSRNGHTQCYCTANTNSKRHYVSNSEGTGQPLGINESCCRNTNQGNGLAPLSR